MKKYTVESDEDEDDGEDDYYRQVKKMKEGKRESIKQQKQEKLAAEFVEPSKHYVEEDGVRAINRKILKNRGLTRKRNKIDRNSRVKLRKKYETALVKIKVILAKSLLICLDKRYSL